MGVIALAARALVPQGTHPTPRAWHRRCKRRVPCRGGIEQAYGQQGYAVTRLSVDGGAKSNGTGNGGAADFRLEKRGQTTLLNCKRWKAANQGVDALRDLAALREAQGADQCIFISLSLPTDKAQRFARENRVQLVCDVDLAKMIA